MLGVLPSVTLPLFQCVLFDVIIYFDIKFASLIFTPVFKEEKASYTVNLTAPFLF